MLSNRRISQCLQRKGKFPSLTYFSFKQAASDISIKPFELVDLDTQNKQRPHQLDSGLWQYLARTHLGRRRAAFLRTPQQRASTPLKRNEKAC